MNLNRATLIGHVGNVPDIRYANEQKMARFSIATSFKWKDNEYTEWHNIVIFDERLAELAEKYIQKGTKLFIEGEIRTRKYEKDGQERYITEIVVPKFRGNIILLGRSKEGGQEVSTSVPDNGGFDDEIPF